MINLRLPREEFVKLCNLRVVTPFLVCVCSYLSILSLMSMLFIETIGLETVGFGRFLNAYVINISRAAG